jgi:hypothetical protein
MLLGERACLEVFALGPHPRMKRVRAQNVRMAVGQLKLFQAIIVVCPAFFVFAGHGRQIRPDGHGSRSQTGTVQQTRGRIKPGAQAGMPFFECRPKVLP